MYYGELENREYWYPNSPRKTPEFHCFFVCFLPLQVFPSPVYPALHLQEYEPTVFTQSALTSGRVVPLVEH